MTRKLFVEDILREVIMVNNDNELHDVTFKIRYPSKKERFLYAVKSILIDELTILAESIAIAAILCSFFSNEWSIPQKYNVFIVLLYVVFFVSQILILLRAALTREIHLKRNNHSES